MRNFRWYIWLMLILFVVAIFWFFGKLILYIVLAVVFSLIARPLVNLLQSIRIGKWKISSGVAAGLSMITIYSFVGLILFFILPILISELQNIGNLDVRKIMLSLEKPLKPIKGFAVQYNILERGQTLWDYTQDSLSHFFERFEISTLLGKIVQLAGDLFIAVFSVSFITFFLLKERGAMYRFVLNLTPPEHEQKVTNVIVHSKKLLSRYFMGLFIEETIVGVLIGLGMELMGMPSALLIGVVAGMVNVIPYIGPFIGMLFAFFILICTNSAADFYSFTLPALVKTFILIQVVHLLDNMFLQPVIYSNSVKAHPLEIFIVIVAAGMLAGIPGLLLAIPVYTLVRIIAREFLGEFKIVQSITDNMYE